MIHKYFLVNTIMIDFKPDVINPNTGYAFKNFESPEQLEMMKKIHELWFKRNVDGFHGEERHSRRDEKVV